MLNVVDLPRINRVPGGVPDLDAALNESYEAAKKHTGLEDPPVKLRILPTLATYRATRQYYPWRGNALSLELTRDDARDLMRDLAQFVVEWVAKRKTEKQAAVPPPAVVG